MKTRRLVSAFLFLGLTSCATMGPIVPETERSDQHTHVIERTKAEIYAGSLEWMTRTFVDSKAVIELKDPENGKIIGKGMGLIAAGMASLPYRFTMIIDIKEKKYRTTFENFTAEYTDEYGHHSSALDKKAHVDQAKSDAEALDLSLWNFLFKEKDW